MQAVKKSSVKQTLVYTWYLYPLIGIFLALLWLWAFPTFHQPTAHQLLNVFFASEVYDSSFLKDLSKEYDRESLRQIDYSYSLRDAPGFTNKIQIAVNASDILILDELTLKDFEKSIDTFFVEINDSIKTNYLRDSYSYYDKEGKDYAILFKEKETDHYLRKYMDFDESQNYYLVLSVASKNLGSVYDENNAHYDNALTFINYLMKEGA